MDKKVLYDNNFSKTIEILFTSEKELTLYMLKLPCPYTIKKIEKILKEPYYEIYYKVIFVLDKPKK